MPTIDSENRKQIRQPMDVLITMSLADTDISMTYSGYSSAKVADGVLDERGWPMRKLADLQGDGFPLDGSCVLYDSTTQPSQANGKLGVRSNVGQSVSVTATGSKVMASLTVLVTGAESVTYNGTTTNIVNNQVTIPVLSTSITMTFAPASQTERIEISDIFPDQEFKITNDNLISATVSLRSDLSLFDQTLPESELNIEVYHGADVTENVASIPEDTPVTYTAGYEGDMSPERKFYVSGQVTWADNVLSIHAVDAVHFLDNVSITAPITDLDSDYFLNVALWVLEKAGVDPARFITTGWWSGKGRWIVREGTSARDFIAFMSQHFNITNMDGDLLDGTGRLNDELMFSYVDAGRPRLDTYGYRPWYQIKESDCGDIKKSVDRIPSQIDYVWDRITNPNFDDNTGAYQRVGSVTWNKSIGASLSYDSYFYGGTIGLFLGENADNDIAQKMSDKFDVSFGYNCMEVVPINAAGWESTGYHYMPDAKTPISERRCGTKLLIGEIPQNEFTDSGETGEDKTFSSFVPWSQRYDSWFSWIRTVKTAAQMWKILTDAKIASTSSTSIDLDIYGWSFNIDPTKGTIKTQGGGDVVAFDTLPVIGEIYATSEQSSSIRIFPDKMLAAPSYRSPIRGSFTWKGDPRMQPRDYVSWERLDGTLEEITIENITITHEGGGTSAEITYRKGVV